MTRLVNLKQLFIKTTFCQMKKKCHIFQAATERHEDTRKVVLYVYTFCWIDQFNCLTA